MRCFSLILFLVKQNHGNRWWSDSILVLFCGLSQWTLKAMITFTRILNSHSFEIHLNLYSIHMVIECALYMDPENLFQLLDFFPNNAQNKQNFPTKGEKCIWTLDCCMWAEARTTSNYNDIPATSPFLKARWTAHNFPSKFTFKVFLPCKLVLKPLVGVD